MRAELIWLRIGTSGGLFGNLKRGVDYFYHMYRYYVLNKDGLCSTELLS
jgi:hypothetical protein